MMPSLNSLISRRSDPAQQGGILGVTQSVSSLARILGPMIGIPLHGVGIGLPYWLAAALMGAGLVLVIVAARGGRDYGTARAALSRSSCKLPRLRDSGHLRRNRPPERPSRRRRAFPAAIGRPAATRNWVWAGSDSRVPSARMQRVAAQGARLAAGQTIGRIRSAARGDQRHVERLEKLDPPHDAVAARLCAGSARAAADRKFPQPHRIAALEDFRIGEPGVGHVRMHGRGAGGLAAVAPAPPQMVS